MRPSTIAWGAALAVVATAGACFIPQPLPDYPAGTITPPRILVDTVTPGDPFIRVGTDCTANGLAPPTFSLGARVYDTNNSEAVVARWFVNYSSALEVTQTPIGGDRIVAPAADPLVLDRVVPGFDFAPYNWSPPVGTGTLGGPPYDEKDTIRVVELLVSNGFYDPAASATPPYRAPKQNFEVQIFRWVFLLVPGTESCGPAL